MPINARLKAQKPKIEPKIEDPVFEEKPISAVLKTEEKPKEQPIKPKIEEHPVIPKIPIKEQIKEKSTVGKVPKKMDILPAIDESTELFNEIKPIEELMKEFKAKLTKTIIEKRWKRIRVDMNDVAKTFRYELNMNRWNWLPKNIRDEAVKQGVHFKKARGRTYVVVTIDEVK